MDSTSLDGKKIELLNLGEVLFVKDKNYIFQASFDETSAKKLRQTVLQTRLFY